jgi:hypothetical protein
VLNNLELEHRRPHALPAFLMKQAISEEQAETLRALEQVGWGLRFVRKQDDGQPLAVVHDPDRDVLAVIEVDGRLVENPPLAFRSP